MGNSDKDTGTVDCSVGAIVWVRRRNGSWWPGKILGPEELSDAHLMSPRSGTPVKLLGREDASVDWYNLEKSKRVKAFRCGEFDDCIERAESSLGMAPKKREKYARREDAILHALELEKQTSENKNGELGCSSAGRSTKSSDTLENVLITPFKGSRYGNGKDTRPKSQSKKVDSSLEDKSVDSPLYERKAKEGNRPAGNEGNSVIPRMRGLQDLGLRIAPSKRRLSSSVALNGSRKPENENMARALPTGDLSTENTVHADSKSSLGKRRTSHELTINESPFRRRDRRRPLVQVLQSSADSPVHHSLQHDNDTVSIPMSVEDQTGSTPRAKRSRYLPGESSDCLDDKLSFPSEMEMLPTKFGVSCCPLPAGFDEENNSESTENTETDSSETDSLHSEADEKMVELSDAAIVTELEPKLPARSGMRAQRGTMTSDDPNDLALASVMTSHCPGDTISASMGVSKWQLKGKRNNRGLAKRSSDLTDRRILRGSTGGTNLEEREINGCDEPDLIEKKFTTRMRSFDNRGVLLTSKSTSRGLGDATHKIIDWEDLAWNDQPVMKGYLDDSSNYLDPVFEGSHSFGGRRKPILVDVDLKVQSSYQREHVPMISLMSKLNGKAIVGHPIQIEALENGSSEILLSSANGICPESLDNDTALPSVWRTARRTAKFRVPRSHPLAATLDGEETAEHFQFLDQDKNMLVENSSLGSSRSRPKMDRKYSRRPPKKVSLSSGQKIKTLSSIGAEQKLGSDWQHGNNNHNVGGLIKRGSGPTAVA
ncbi:hypothetical protein RHMOL_Rhmol09G0273900 [Rhododendron molle]|uniref:Uncharacterized protein n=1 Tax=Rhododendron molle TaxID=49168 RepID=A0ACC0MHW4_RHOML|nr:hypothetical protein RHMOL_Rhmol09G0273900 [Rhododendron molle]